MKSLSIQKSAGAIVFRRKKNVILYLLLHYQAGHWDFPKGHIEKGEGEEDALRREVLEETGIKHLRLIPGFRKKIKYFFQAPSPFCKRVRTPQLILKFVIFYLAETRTKKIKISFEHTDYRWLPYEKARKLLTFKSAKVVLREAARFLHDV